MCAGVHTKRFSISIDFTALPLTIASDKGTYETSVGVSGLHIRLPEHLIFE